VIEGSGQAIYWVFLLQSTLAAPRTRFRLKFQGRYPVKAFSMKTAIFNIGTIFSRIAHFEPRHDGS
jgi:hypothetical protein